METSSNGLPRRSTAVGRRAGCGSGRLANLAHQGPSAASGAGIQYSTQHLCMSPVYRLATGIRFLVERVRADCCFPEVEHTHLPHQLYSAPFIIHPRPPHSPLIYPMLFVSCTAWMFHTRFSTMLVRNIIGGGIYGRRISWKRECIWSNMETRLRSACATLYVSCSVVEVPVW